MHIFTGSSSLSGGENWTASKAIGVIISHRRGQQKHRRGEKRTPTRITQDSHQALHNFTNTHTQSHQPHPLHVHPRNSLNTHFSKSTRQNKHTHYSFSNPLLTHEIKKETQKKPWQIFLESAPPHFLIFTLHLFFFFSTSSCLHSGGWLNVMSCPPGVCGYWLDLMPHTLLRWGGVGSKFRG